MIFNLLVSAVFSLVYFNYVSGNPAIQSRNYVEAAHENIQANRRLVAVPFRQGLEERDVSSKRILKRDHVLHFLDGKVDWTRDAFDKIDIHFGTELQKNAIQKDMPLLKRQSTPSTDASSASAIPSSDFPSTTVAPSSTPTSTSVHAYNFDETWRNTDILPPKFPGIGSAIPLVPNLPAGLTVGCAECSIKGSIDIVSGVINANSNGGNSSEDILDFLQSGYIELAVNRFSAHIELDSTVAASQTLATYTTSFPDISIPGFSIPGLAVVGPILRPAVKFGVKIGADLEFTYGFNLSVPDNSTVFLNIGETSNSTVSGFQDTHFNILPFSAKLDSIHLTASIALVPKLLTTISFLENRAGINAGAFLDLPQLSADVAQVMDVDEHCNPSNETDQDEQENLKKQGRFYDSLIKIKPAVGFDVGVQAEGDAIVTTKSELFTAFSTQTDVPTACYSFDARRHTFATPTTSSMSGTGSGATGTPGHKGEAAADLRERLVRCAMWASGLCAISVWLPTVLY
ncbi:MAG: hypothetical protein Q9227_005020 [Pyrenula ochraceoflavens]